MVVRVSDLAWFSAYAVLRSVVKWKPYVYVGACVRVLHCWKYNLVIADANGGAV